MEKRREEAEMNAMLMKKLGDSSLVSQADGKETPLDALAINSTVIDESVCLPHNVSILD